MGQKKHAIWGEDEEEYMWRHMMKVRASDMMNQHVVAPPEAVAAMW